MKRLLQALVTTLLFVSPALAHDAKFHKGPKVEGTVVSLNGEQLAVATDNGIVNVALSDETKYEQGAEGAPAERGALKEGEHVIVSGHKLESGQFAASRVLVQGDAHDASGERCGGDDHGAGAEHTH